MTCLTSKIAKQRAEIARLHRELTAERDAKALLLHDLQAERARADGLARRVEDYQEDQKKCRARN